MTVVGVRAFLSCLTPRQLVYISGSTEKTYLEWLATSAQPRGLLSKPESVVLSDNISKIHWIRSGQPASKVILFFHGGGYSAPLTAGHLNWCGSLITRLGADGIPLAAAVLEYGLAPEHKYPRQLQQAAAALQQVIELGFNPSSIFLGGDSAGAHLALGLLGHAMHKHPSIEKLKLESPLAGVFLISPWLTDDTLTRSYKENFRVDMLPFDAARKAERYLVPPSLRQAEVEAGHGWAMAMDACDDWWLSLPEVVGSVYITAGDEEMFRDHIVLFSRKLKDLHPSLPIQLEVESLQAHDHMLTYELMGYEENPALDRLTSWFSSVLHISR